MLWVLLRARLPSASANSPWSGPLHGDWWKLFTHAVRLRATGCTRSSRCSSSAIFGWLLERRFGPIVVLALFFGAGAAGALVALAVYPLPVVIGANAGALALLAAWAAPDLRAARAGDYYEGDLLGAGALAALLLAMPFVLRLPEASWLAGVTGGRAGPARRRSACSGCEPRCRRDRTRATRRSRMMRRAMTMTNAVVLIEAERDALSTLGGALADIEGVAEAYSVTGEWDFVAIVRVPDHEQLADVVTAEIGGLSGVLRTQTMVAFAAFSRHDLEALFSIGE